MHASDDTADLAFSSHGVYGWIATAGLPGLHYDCDVSLWLLRLRSYIASGQGLGTIGLVHEDGLAFAIYFTFHSYNYLVGPPLFLHYNN